MTSCSVSSFFTQAYWATFKWYILFLHNGKSTGIDGVIGEWGWNTEPTFHLHWFFWHISHTDKYHHTETYNTALEWVGSTMAAVRIMFFNTYLNNAFFVSITRRSISLFFHPTVLPVWQLFSPPCLKNKSLAGVVMDFAASQRKQYLWARGGLFWWRGGWGGWELVLLVLCAFCSQTRH